VLYAVTPCLRRRLPWPETGLSWGKRDGSAKVTPFYDADVSVAAVLWDMDGLLVDSEPLWTVAEEELACQLGGQWGDDVKAACMGMRLDRAVPAMLSAMGLPARPADVTSASDFLLARMVQLYADGAPLLPGAAELLAAVSAAGIPNALVSSSYRCLVDAVLDRAGRSRFEVSISGDEVTEAKPAPEPYLRAAAELGVDPMRCVVLEDSVAGALSGAAAGCGVVLVPGPPLRDGRDLRGPWQVVSSLTDLGVAELAATLPG
jgi:HAD superfamily hydrolase (TIGR01509 family)